MKTSELFMDAFCNNLGSPCVSCEFCGRVHFTHEDDDYVGLCAKSAAEPEKYIEDQENDSIAWGYLEGKQYVWRCPCDSGHRFERFIWAHREGIVEYIKARAKREAEEANANLKLTESVTL